MKSIGKVYYIPSAESREQLVRVLNESGYKLRENGSTGYVSVCIDGQGEAGRFIPGDFLITLKNNGRIGADLEKLLSQHK